MRKIPLELFARKSESDFSHAVWPAACMRWPRLMEGPLAWVHVFPRAMDVHTLTHTQQIQSTLVAISKDPKMVRVI